MVVVVVVLQGEWTCMGVRSNGSYGVDRSLFYSFPVTLDSAGKYHIVDDLQLDTDTISHVTQSTRQLRADLDHALAIDDLLPPVSFEDPTTPQPPITLSLIHI